MNLKTLALFVDEVGYENFNNTQLFIDYITYFKNLNDYNIYKNYTNSVDTLFIKNFNTKNKELFKVFYFKLFSNKTELIQLIKDKVFIYPLVTLFLEIDCKDLPFFINLFLSNLNTITSYSMFAISYDGKTFKSFLKNFYLKFSLNLLKILHYLKGYKLSYETESLDSISADDQISSYYNRYKNLDYIYFMGKGKEKIEKKVLLRAFSPLLLSKY